MAQRSLGETQHSHTHPSVSCYRNMNHTMPKVRPINIHCPRKFPLTHDSWSWERVCLQVSASHTRVQPPLSGAASHQSLWKWVTWYLLSPCCAADTHLDTMQRPSEFPHNAAGLQQEEAVRECIRTHTPLNSGQRGEKCRKYVTMTDGVRCVMEKEKVYNGVCNKSDSSCYFHPSNHPVFIKLPKERLV